VKRTVLDTDVSSLSIKDKLSPASRHANRRPPGHLIVRQPHPELARAVRIPAASLPSGSGSGMFLGRNILRMGYGGRPARYVIPRNSRSAGESRRVRASSSASTSPGDRVPQHAARRDQLSAAKRKHRILAASP